MGIIYELHSGPLLVLQLPFTSWDPCYHYQRGEEDEQAVAVVSVLTGHLCVPGIHILLNGEIDMPPTIT